MNPNIKMCFQCNLKTAYSIDGGWRGEVDRPYKIYVCAVCHRIFTKYDDEL